MKYRNTFAVIVFLLATQTGWADLSIRYKVDLKFGSALPADVTGPIKQQLGDALPSETAMQVKGSRCSASLGATRTVTDAATGQTLIFNTRSKQVATVGSADFLAKVVRTQPIPLQAQQMLENLNFDFQSRPTGQTMTVEGIRAEENLVTVSMEIPIPAGPAPSAGFRVEVHQWMATAEEVARVPELKELAGCSSGGPSSFDLNQTLRLVFSQTPGLAAKLAAPLEELRKNAGRLVVKTQAAVYVPAIAAMVQLQGQSLPRGFDPNAPLMEIESTLAEFSTNPLDNSIFDVPADYQKAPIDDLVKAIRPEVVKPAQRAAAPPQPPIAAQTPLPPGVRRIGNGVSAPSVISQIQPLYTEDARQAKLSGTVALSLVVDETGRATNIKVVRPLGLGLDENAIAAVLQWEFKPGMKDGQPVPVLATVEVNFRLLNTPPVQP